MGRAEFAHHPALPRCYAAGIRLALEVEILGIRCGFLVHYPGRSRCPFSRDEARENGFTGERRGGTFNRSIAQKSAASPQHVQRRKERTVMKVLIAGASGALGTPLTRALIAAGHEVLGLARSPESIDRLTHLGAHPILANVMDRDDLERAVKGVQADAVIHALTALKKTPLRHQDMYATNALRDVGTTNLLAAAREVGARRFVAERSEEHTSELQSHSDLVCRLLLEKKKTEHRRIRMISYQHKSSDVLQTASRKLACRDGKLILLRHEQLIQRHELRLMIAVITRRCE